MVAGEARICWQSRLTGYRGCGSWMPVDLAQAWKEHCDARWSHLLDHWLEYRDPSARSSGGGEGEAT